MMKTALPLREHAGSIRNWDRQSGRDCAAESNSLEDMSIAEGRVDLSHLTTDNQPTGIAR